METHTKQANQIMAHTKRNKKVRTLQIYVYAILSLACSLLLQYSLLFSFCS